MSADRAIMYAVAALLLAGGILLYARIGLAHLSERARYAHMIGGTMAVAGGACLAIFASIFFTATAS